MLRVRSALKAFLLTGFTVLGGLSATAGEASGGDKARAEADAVLLSQIGAFLRYDKATTVGQTVERMQAQFRQLDVTGEGISEASQELVRRIETARLRSHRIAAILANDLDGDGVVTRAEVEDVLRRQSLRPLRSGDAQVMPTGEQMREILRTLVDKVMEADTDHDGRITFDEMRASADKAAAGTSRYRATPRGEVPAGLDADGDGTVTLAEYVAAVRRVLAEIDTDQDGTITPDEATAAHSRIEAAQRAGFELRRREQEAQEAAARVARCNLPKPDPSAMIVAIGGYHGRALSSVSIGGDDVTTSVAQVEIEQGDQPLFIVASSYESMVWQVSGAVDRVSQFLVSAYPTAGAGKVPRVGVVGLPAGRVSAPNGGDCLKYFTSTSDTAGLQAQGALRVMLGRAPDLAVATYAMDKVALPSGRFDDNAHYRNTMILPKIGPAVGMWREALRFNPGGVAMIEPKAVVSPLPVKAYDVLPQQAGLAQLLEDGALVTARSSRVRRFGRTTIVGDAHVDGDPTPSEEYTVSSELRIVRKTQFPAGLTGAHSVKFILGKDVPVPDGDPGHSTVISEETGQTLPIGLNRHLNLHPGRF